MTDDITSDVLDLSETGPPEFTVSEVAEAMGMSHRGLAFRCPKYEGKGTRKINDRLWLISRDLVKEWMQAGKLAPGRPTPNNPRVVKPAPSSNAISETGPENFSGAGVDNPAA